MLKVGTETASLVNHLYSRQCIGQPVPVAGMGATICHWSDRDAATVFKVWEAGRYRYMEVRQDRATVTSGSGHDGSAVYAHTSNPNGSRYTYRQCIDSSDSPWLATRQSDSGRWVKATGAIRLGTRESYRDPSF